MTIGGGAAETPAPAISLDHKRDAYGFAVRPQHLQRFKEYANIYKEEEEERSKRWKDFLGRQCQSTQSGDSIVAKSNDESTAEDSSKDGAEAKDANGRKPENLSEENEDAQSETGNKGHQVRTWAEIRPSLRAIEDLMSARVKKVNLMKNEPVSGMKKKLSAIEEARPGKGASEDDSDEEFYDLERSESDTNLESLSAENSPALDSPVDGHATHSESLPPWKEELECLVQGGVPMELRGELWQAFVGLRARRVDNYYHKLLSPETDEDDNHESDLVREGIPEKWRAQIEKDLPRTFPGHPALDEDGRNALRRVLTAYARHNQSVGYCQAMNFFAGLLLLLMPEETAFWTLVGVLDDYFDGYYSEEMLESQVDQLVLEDLVREKFPKLVNHLDYLGVEVAWVTGPWFLTIFMNMLPWESVLRVWDVLLFEGNRVMLFRTTLALMELYGPALVTTKDAGDAVTLLQSLAGSTFDSSQLVLTACMAYQNVQETRLEELRTKHRPSVKVSLEERSKDIKAWKLSQGLASKLYSFKKDPGFISGDELEQRDMQVNGDISHLDSSLVDGDEERDPVKDLKEQVVWLKVELCNLLEEKRSSELRAEELETALMEMVKQDNRRQLSARVEQLELEISEIRQALADKQEQENAMLQILMRVEQEQKVTEDARMFAEQDAAAQRYAAQMLQDKYEEASATLAEMEKRAVLAESMLEATLQYQSVRSKTQRSPRSPRSTPQSNQDHSPEIQARKTSLLSRWRDRNKEKPTGAEEPNDEKSHEGENSSLKQDDTNGHEVQKKV
ncbi:TBC1 domain family member 8B-like [Salvia splendens]|uniref:TBC1 domain family member 8B-like n=1 Tax=Salvia splendens TaxID=180675 RepID=UPI001C278B4C|nr:TBC1 domain family member 8B-like [Salvia splendens]